jgi:hypothetical protein
VGGAAPLGHPAEASRDTALEGVLAIFDRYLAGEFGKSSTALGTARASVLALFTDAGTVGAVGALGCVSRHLSTGTAAGAEGGGAGSSCVRSG